ncbi:hypothetical protein EQG67_17535 [Kosakonia cowanii]|nr:hypothetical protein EQG67_17535 [Kosakonia cowanii]
MRGRDGGFVLPDGAALIGPTGAVPERGGGLYCPMALRLSGLRVRCLGEPGVPGLIRRSRHQAMAEGRAIS